MKILRNIFIGIWTIFCIIGIAKNYSHYGIDDWIIIILFVSIPYIALFLVFRRKAKISTNETTNIIPPLNNKPTTETEALHPQYIESNNVIYRTDGKAIQDDEIPYLIQLGYEKALNYQKASINPKFHRTEREEELSFQFEMKHGNEIQKRTDSFEELNRLAYKESDLNKKIDLLQKTIVAYEKAKVWFYRTKGGTIYFQDYYEYMHNSQNEYFSYIDSVKVYLKDCIKERDYIIPKIIDVITSQNGILQKDIYQHIPDISKSDIQRIIKKLETDNRISRNKQGNSYFLTLRKK